MSILTFDRLIADQTDRIQRNNLKQGENSVLDFINDINNDLKDGFTHKRV